jgi:hypothetical protein
MLSRIAGLFMAILRARNDEVCNFPAVMILCEVFIKNGNREGSLQQGFIG